MPAPSFDTAMAKLRAEHADKPDVQAALDRYAEADREVSRLLSLPLDKLHAEAQAWDAAQRAGAAA